jgi:hypothetical protein
LSHFTVVYDACVLYPAPLRDLLMHLAVLDLFRAKWSAMIHDEWIGNLLKNRPDLTSDQLQRTRDLMDANVRDCLVTAAKRHRASLKKYPKTVIEYLETLESLGLVQTVAELRKFSELI